MLTQAINRAIVHTVSMYVEKILKQKGADQIQTVDNERHLYLHTNTRGRKRYFKVIVGKRTVPLSLYFSPHFEMTKYNGFFIAIGESPECFAEIERWEKNA